jgi:hypothetical protein
MPSGSSSKRERLLHKLLREVTRSESQAVDHAAAESRRIGDAPPAIALREVAAHVLAMKPRLVEMSSAHGLELHRSAFGSRLSTLRQLVADRVSPALADAEHAYRTAILDLRHGIDVVRVLREVSRRHELFGLIRWSDDWLRARRTLVAGVEARLVWFADASARARDGHDGGLDGRDLGNAASDVRPDRRPKPPSDASSAPDSERKPTSPQHDRP